MVANPMHRGKGEQKLALGNSVSAERDLFVVWREIARHQSAWKF